MRKDLRRVRYAVVLIPGWVAGSAQFPCWKHDVASRSIYLATAFMSWLTSAARSIAVHNRFAL